MSTRKTQAMWLAFVLTLMFVGVPDSFAAPAGDGGGLLGLLDVAVQNQMDDLFATEDPTIANADPATDKFGPYPSTTGDSGTCGVVDWAVDTVNRYFSIRLVAPNTYSVVEKFKKGTFTTLGSPSPGACDNSDGTPPGVITTGFSGTFHGYLVMTVTAPVYSPGTASCPTPCFFTGDFLRSVFGPLFVRTDDAFFFHYVSDDPRSLVYHEWKNASCNRGGNHGDIASAAATGPVVEVPVCP